MFRVRQIIFQSGTITYADFLNHVRYKFQEFSVANLTYKTLKFSVRITEAVYICNKVYLLVLFWCYVSTFNTLNAYMHKVFHCL